MPNPRFSGPMPGGQGALWCSLCSAVYKGAALARPEIREKIQAALRGDEEVRIDLRLGEGLPELEEAVTWAVMQVPGPGQPAVAAVPACWSHMSGATIMSSGLQVSGPMVPELGRSG